MGKSILIFYIDLQNLFHNTVLQLSEWVCAGFLFDIFQFVGSTISLGVLSSGCLREKKHVKNMTVGCRRYGVERDQLKK